MEAEHTPDFKDSEAETMQPIDRENSPRGQADGEIKQGAPSPDHGL